MPLEDIRNERLKKLAVYENALGDAYPASVSRTHTVAEARKNFAKLAKSKKRIAIAGRLMAFREHGGATFGNLRDESGELQVYFKKDVLGEKKYSLLTEAVDVGDFLALSGTLFKTKRGEETLEAKSWVIAAKSLRPLPEKWHGLQDVEERFRRRYLDLLMNAETKGRFFLRAKLFSFIRSFFEKSGFVEFETPMLHPIPGGALARPFKTHHNALDADFYLRIAPELYLKRLLVGGFERVYELGRNFRNEGMDASHNPEFTMLECYSAWWDEEAMMKFVEEFFSGAVSHFFNKKEFEYEGKKITPKTPFKRLAFKELLKRYALINDYDAMSRDDLALAARQLGLAVEKYEPKGKIADEIYKKIARPHLIEPTFVVHHPVDISPLAKARGGNKGEVRRFQLIVGGTEIANGFAELNDPAEQVRRFREQEKARIGGEREAHPMDIDFVEALEYGMPPAAGLGVGIDRLFMLFTNTHNIKEAIIFPTMRPK